MYHSIWLQVGNGMETGHRGSNLLDPKSKPTFCLLIYSDAT